MQMTFEDYAAGRIPEIATIEEDPLVRLDTSMPTFRDIAQARWDQKRGRGQIDKRVDDRHDPLEVEIGGLLGEFAVAQYCTSVRGEVITPNLAMESDGGIDLIVGNTSVDVKFSRYDYADLFFQYISKFKADVAIKVVPDFSVVRTYDKFLKQDHPTVRLVGWIRRHEFLERYFTHLPLLPGERPTTWQGVGMTPPRAKIKDCRKCAHHHSPIHEFNRSVALSF